jgi:hypothetical protein|tara:strand:+ start:99 stop:350 length:252 start_codon:yes stop_codon:yes gene_type:complete
MQNFTGTGFTNDKIEKLAVPTVGITNKKQATTYLKFIQEKINEMFDYGIVHEDEYNPNPDYNKKDFNDMLQSLIDYVDNMPHD